MTSVRHARNGPLLFGFLAEEPGGPSFRATSGVLFHQDGWGLQLAEAPSTVDRLLVERAFDLGLIASGAASAVTARDVALLALAGGKVVTTGASLLDTREAVCGESCKGGGTGAAVFHAGSALELADFVIERSPLIGLQLGAGARLHARRGLLARNLVAMNVLEPGFDFSTALESVKVFENGVDLASEVVPVPAVGPLQHPPDAGN